MITEPAVSRTESGIPIVDFAGFESPDPAVRAATAAAIRRAFEEVGFLYLRNHGVPRPALDAMWAQSRWFFGQPQDYKETVRWPSAASNRGYIPPAGQSLQEDQPHDLKEAYHAGYDDREPANLWPDGAPAFREGVLAFHAAAAQACGRIMRAVAVGYGLPEDYFVSFFERTRGATRLLHYPPLAGEPLPGQLRAGAHTDFGAVSLLFQDDAGGLEIQHPDGRWLPAPALPDAAIVNTGDLMQRWTNDLVRSSPHRVVNPIGDAAQRARYSSVLFFSPSPDKVIECLEPCQGPERPARYPPITAGAHVLARTKATHKADE